MLNDLYAAYDQQSSSSIPTEGIFMPDYENMIGMELTLPNPVFNDTRGMPYFLTEEQAANVADPSKVKEDCFNNICEFYYDVGYELTREDVISVGYNDYSVRYTYDDTQEESTNVPEPAPAALMGLALAGGFIARRKKK